jgi:hypothetical protein
LSRILRKTDPEEANRLEGRVNALQAEHLPPIVLRHSAVQALASADAHDWPKAISQLEDALQTCGRCGAAPLLHKDFDLTYFRSGEFKSGRVELLAAQNLPPGIPDVAKALQLLNALIR